MITSQNADSVHSDEDTKMVILCPAKVGLGWSECSVSPNLSYLVEEDFTLFTFRVYQISEKSSNPVIKVLELEGQGTREEKQREKGAEHVAATPSGESQAILAPSSQGKTTGLSLSIDRSKPETSVPLDTTAPEQSTDTFVCNPRPASFLDRELPTPLSKRPSRSKGAKARTSKKAKRKGKDSGAIKQQTEAFRVMLPISLALDYSLISIENN